jgi:hypothetical protein
MTAYTNHHLTAEHVNDKSGPAVMLTQQEGIEDAETIIIHPWQLVAACQHLGLIETSDATAQKTIATSQRRMLALRDRIDNLVDWMEKFSDHKHADLTYEMTQLHALQELAFEWCYDLDDNASATATPASSLSTVDSNKPPECRPAQTAQAELL